MSCMKVSNGAFQTVYTFRLSYTEKVEEARQHPAAGTSTFTLHSLHVQLHHSQAFPP